MKNKFTLVNIKKFLLHLVKSPLFYVLIGLIAIDIISKWCVELNLKEGQTIVIIPGLIQVTLTHNTGMVFGIGGTLGARIAIIIIRLILAIAIPICVFIYSSQIKTRYRVIILMIYAGCIGNLIDGMFYWEKTVGFNGVIDWIQFPWKWFSYIFNLADAFIVIAVFLAIIFIIIDEVKEVKERSRRGEYTLTPEEYEKKLKAEKEQNENNNK